MLESSSLLVPHSCSISTAMLLVSATLESCVRRTDPRSRTATLSGLHALWEEIEPSLETLPPLRPSRSCNRLLMVHGHPYPNQSSVSYLHLPGSAMTWDGPLSAEILRIPEVSAGVKRPPQVLWLHVEFPRRAEPLIEVDWLS